MLFSNQIIVILLTVAVCSGFDKSSYIWNPTDEWSPCSKPCGVGIETQKFVCLKRTYYRTLEYTKTPKCSKADLPIKTRNCSFGDCNQTLTGSFVWQVGNWSICPKSCGGSALQNRDVNCFLMTSRGQFLLTKLSKCSYKLEPPRFLSCAKADCPPTFLASKWNKCPETRDCRTTIRRRKVKCGSLLHNAQMKFHNSGICYRLGQKPPSTWMTCISNMDQHCLNIKKENKKLDEKIKITEDKSLIYQMRHTKRLKLFVGQTAHVFAFTRLAIFCPIEDLHRSKIKWEHGNKTYEYKGSSKGRIKVSRKGVLLIREFYLMDQGVWRCRIRNFTSDAVLKMEQPSNGFDNWLRRHANHNYGMLNEESNITFIRPESVLWMKSDWTPCSITCENNNKSNPGFQTRKVTCEKIESQYYKIIDDKYCSQSTKPISEKKCKTIHHCPAWKVQLIDKKMCTNYCIDVGIARTQSKIVCQYKNKTVDSSMCDKDKMPNITCPNPNCKISYLYGPWSQCSQSCSNITDVGFRSRTMKCVWEGSVNPAYHLCQQNRLTYYPLMKPCKVPKCILGCKNLTPSCEKQSKYRCHSSLFYHFCCAFCKKHF